MPDEILIPRPTNGISRRALIEGALGLTVLGVGAEISLNYRRLVRLFQTISKDRGKKQELLRPFLDPSERDPHNDTYTVTQEQPVQSAVNESMIQHGYRQTAIISEDPSQLPETVYQEAQSLPKNVNVSFSELQKVLNTYHTQDSQVHTVEVYDNPDKEHENIPIEDAAPTQNGLPGNKLVIQIVLDRNIPVSIRELAHVIFHENMHVFNGDAVVSRGNENYTDNYSDYQKMFLIIRSQAIQSALQAGILKKNEVQRRNGFYDLDYANAGEDSLTILYKKVLPFLRQTPPPPNVLATFVQESGYGESYGHVIFSADELFASTLNVLYAYPKSWIKSISQLTPNEQQFMITLAKKTLSILRDTMPHGVGNQMIHQFFSQDILEFIGFH